MPVVFRNLKWISTATQFAFFLFFLFLMYNCILYVPIRFSQWYVFSWEFFPICRIFLESLMLWLEKYPLIVINFLKFQDHSIFRVYMKFCLFRCVSLIPSSFVYQTTSWVCEIFHEEILTFNETSKIPLLIAVNCSHWSKSTSKRHTNKYLDWKRYLWRYFTKPKRFLLVEQSSQDEVENVTKDLGGNGYSKFPESFDWNSQIFCRKDFANSGDHMQMASLFCHT